MKIGGLHQVPEIASDRHDDGFHLAEDIVDFLTLLRRGHPIPVKEPAPGQDKRKFEQSLQRYEFERSIDYLRNVCGVGKQVNI